MAAWKFPNRIVSELWPPTLGLAVEKGLNH
jgi:hypothetical protein